MASASLRGRGLLSAAGIIAIALGASVCLLSRKVTVEDLGTFEWYWVLIVGLTIAMLGAAIFVGTRRFARDRADGRPFLSIMLACIIMNFIGLVMLTYTSPMVLEGIGGVRGFWLGLFGVVLVLLSLETLIIAAANRFAPKSLGSLGPYGLACDAAMITEGLALMGFAGDLTWKGDFSVGVGYVVLAGAQLALMGVVMAIAPFLNTFKPSSRWPGMVSLVATVVVALEGLVVVALADSVQLGPYSYSLSVLVVSGAQLALLAAVSLFCHAFSPLGSPSMQGKAFLACVLIVLAIPVLAVLLHM